MLGKITAVSNPAVVRNTAGGPHDEKNNKTPEPKVYLQSISIFDI